MAFFESNGARFFYRWAGVDNGPVVVLSHSLGSSSELWQLQIVEMGARFRLLLYDHRGHGQSDGPPTPWSIDDFGRDHISLLDYLELDRVHFCGISLGGMVGMWMAQQAPQRLDRLVIANTSAYTEDPSLLQSRMKLIGESGLEAIADNVLDRWFTGEYHHTNPGVIERFREQLLKTPANSYLATSRAICDLDLRDGLDAISTPTLVITGKEDQATPPAWGEAIAFKIPGAMLEELNAAHLSNVEAAEKFNRVVIDFLMRA